MLDSANTLTDYTKLCQEIYQKIHRKCNYDRFNNWRMPKGFWGIQSPKKGRKVAIFKFGPISGWKRSFTVCNFKFCKLLTNTSPSPITAIPYGALTFPAKNLPMYSPVTEVVFECDAHNWSRQSLCWDSWLRGRSTQLQITTPLGPYHLRREERNSWGRTLQPSRSSFWWKFSANLRDESSIGR